MRPLAFSLPLMLLAALAVVAPVKSAPAKVASSRARAATRPRVDPADLALYERLCTNALTPFDSARGGFVRRDGTPCEAAIELALARGRDGDALAMRRALFTLHWMHALLDTVGGGFVSGTRDLGVLDTHFEKLTWFNARRFELLAMAAQASPDPAWPRDARACVDYFERVLLDPRGGFVTGQMGSRDLEPEANGLTVQAWMRWGAMTRDGRRRDFAWKSLDRLWNECRDADLGMVRKDVWGQIRDPSLLADQVEMGRACLRSWQATGRDSDLARARALAAHIKLRFEDGVRGGWRNEYAIERFGHARRSPRTFDDNARAARFAVEIGMATGDTSRVNAARRAWTSFAKQLEKSRLESAEWALAVRATWAPEPLARADWSVTATPRHAVVKKRVYQSYKRAH